MRKNDVTPSFFLINPKALALNGGRFFCVDPPLYYYEPIG
jgi:hypothetical protein